MVGGQPRARGVAAIHAHTGVAPAAGPIQTGHDPPGIAHRWFNRGPPLQAGVGLFKRVLGRKDETHGGRTKPDASGDEASTCGESFDSSKLRTLCETRNYEESLAYCDKFQSTDPYIAYILATKAWALHSLGMLDEAMDCLDRLSEIKPNDDHRRQHQATIMSEMNDPIARFVKKDIASKYYSKYEGIVADCDRELNDDPNRVELHARKAFALRRLGRYDDSLECYDRVLKLNSSDIKTIYNVANLLYHTGNYEQALVYCDRALEIDPSYQLALFRRFMILVSLNRNETEYPVGSIPGYSVKLNNTANIIACREEIFNIQTDNPSILFIKGVLHNIDGRYVEAIACYKAAIKLKPNYDIMSNIAGELFKLGEHKDSMI